jgi:hypothetical protein
MAGEAQEIVDTSEDDAAAQAAFDAEVGGGIPTETPEPKPAEEVKPEVKPEPEPEPAPAVEYAQITKAEYADLMAKASQVDKAFGKIGGIERVLQQLQTPGQAVEVNEEDFAALSAEFPELAKTLIESQKKAFARIKGAATVDPAVVEKIVSERVEKTRKEMIDSTLDQIVGGDWVADRHSEEFKQWEAAQPAEIQNLAASDDLRDAARMMRAWKAHKDAPKPAPVPPPKPSSRRQQLEAAAATPKGTGGSIQANPNSDEAAQAAFDAQFT